MSHLGPGLGLDAATARRRTRPFFLASAFRLDGQAPALAADFVRGRHALGGAPASAAALLTVSSGAKTVFDASGAPTVSAANAPAYDHRTGRRCLLIEGPATNTLTFPADLTQAAWVKNFASAALVDGWSQIRETTSTNFHRVGRSSLTWAAGTTYTVSALIRRVGRRYFFFRLSVGGAGPYNVTFDLDTGAVIRADNGYTGSIRQITTDVWLLTATFVGASGTSQLYLNASPTDPSAGAGSWAGDSNTGFDLRYIQLEAGTIATSFVDGGASTGARTADVVQLAPAAGAVLQGAAGSLAWRGRVRAAVAAQPLVDLPSGFGLLRGGTTAAELHLDGSTSAALTLGSPIPGEVGAAIGWDGTGRAGAVNGAAAVADAAALDRSRASIFLGGSSGLPAGCALEIDEIVAWTARGSGTALTGQARGWQ